MAINPNEITWDDQQPIDASQIQWDAEKQIPQWGQENPRLYSAAQTARQYGAPILEGLGMVGGGLIGAPAGPVGAVGGAGLGYGMARELVGAADVVLGNKPRQELPEQAKEAAKNVLEGATYEAGGRVLGDVAGAIGRAIPESVKATPEKIASFLRAREAGYVVPPSQMTPTWGTRALESISGKAETGQIASLRNQETTNKLARQALGLSPEVPLSKESMQKYRSAQYNEGYKPIENLGKIELGSGFNQSLDDIIKANTGDSTIPAIENKQITEVVNSFKNKGVNTITNQPAQVSSSDVMNAIKTLRRNADDAFDADKNALGRTYRKIADTYENAVQDVLAKSNKPELLDSFVKSRQNMAKSYDIESAIKEGTGSVDAKKIAGLLQKDEPLTGQLRQIGEFANVFPDSAVLQQKSVAVNNLRPYASTALAGAGGSLFGWPGAVAGGALGMAAPAAARSVLFSPAMQARLAQTPQPAMTAEMLRQYVPNSVRMLPPTINQFTGNQQ